ncbi:Chromo shadow domain protein [Trichostrongylus colubriformis]|uniref:Chromo shadow domain protein n=1 Tax=Trichostrongylus colubriformis TaxID=6319 RepID=A0AAN8IB76_TRICO
MTLFSRNMTVRGHNPFRTYVFVFVLVLDVLFLILQDVENELFDDGTAEDTPKPLPVKRKDDSKYGVYTGRKISRILDLNTKESELQMLVVYPDNKKTSKTDAEPVLVPCDTTRLRW